MPTGQAEKYLPLVCSPLFPTPQLFDYGCTSTTSRLGCGGRSSFCLAVTIPNCSSLILLAETDWLVVRPTMSSKSSTPNSTSTYAYSHEPFDSFQSKVSQLARRLGQCAEVEIRRVRGGSYNRTVAATLTGDGSSIAGIFRIPRFSNATKNEGNTDTLSVDKNILDHAAVLQFLATRGVLAPRLLAFDSTVANEIASPYTFQAFSMGTCLNLVYGNMTAPEKRSIVDSLVDFLVPMEFITFSHAGSLAVAPASAGSLKRSLFSDANQTAMSVQTRGFQIPHDGVEVEPKQSLYDLLSSLLDARVEREGPAYAGGTRVAVWSGSARVLQEMRDCGFFCGQQPGDSVNVLYHWDLEPRNIMIRPKQTLSSEEAAAENTEWTFDTVIDWDDVYCLPSILTRRPPRWL